MDTTSIQHTLKKVARRTLSQLMSPWRFLLHSGRILIGYYQLKRDQTKNQVRHIQALSKNWVKYKLPLHLLNFDYSVSRTLFGNVACVNNNIIGFIRQKKAQRSAPRRLSTSSKPLARQLRNDGFVSLPGQMDAALIQRVAEKYQSLIEREATSLANTGSLRIALPPGQYFSRDLKPHAYYELPEIAALLTDDLVQVIEDYYGSYFEVALVHCYRNYYAPAEITANTEVFSDWWHCDLIPTDRLMLFVTLSDVTEADGPFHVVSRERTQELIRLGYRNRWDYGTAASKMEDASYLSRLVGPKGTGMFCNTSRCLHRAALPTQGRTRDMLQFMFQSSTVPLSKDWYRCLIDRSQG